MPHPRVNESQSDGKPGAEGLLTSTLRQADSLNIIVTLTVSFVLRNEERR